MTMDLRPKLIFSHLVSDRFVKATWHTNYRQKHQWLVDYVAGWGRWLTREPTKMRLHYVSTWSTYCSKGISGEGVNNSSAS